MTKEIENALSKLMLMVNDLEGQSLFEKDGPLGWFSIDKTYKYALTNDILNEKQIDLLNKVFDQYKHLKKISAQFVATKQGVDLASEMHSLLSKKPKNSTKEDRNFSQKYSKLVHTFHDGVMIHIGYFSRAERLIGQFPALDINDKVSLWEKIHSARRCYLEKYYGELRK